jgi:hypothetical protein
VPRYHFNVLDGVSEYDEAGTEMSGIAEAKREARRYAAGMLADSALIHNPDDEWRIEVTDHHGLILFSLEIMMLDTPIVIT